MSFYYGAHISTSKHKGIVPALEECKKNGGNFAQIFISNPRTGKFKAKESSELAEIKKFLKTNKMALVIHSPYVLNFSKPCEKDKKIKDCWWVQTLYSELCSAVEMGAFGCVLHCGKKLKLKEEEAIDNMKKALQYVISKMKNNKALILLETSAGQGSELFFKLDDFAKFYNMFSATEKKKFKLCVDTAHIFAAGYDIKTDTGVKNYFKEFDKLIGIKHLALIHLNDSKTKLSSRVDRHQTLGNGEIGIKGIKEVILFAKKNKIPITLETPDEGYIKEIPMIKKICEIK